MKTLYSVEQVPTFQNKVYNSFEEAINSPKGNVEVVIDEESGLLKNQLFDNSVMEYDQNYQNEQNHSPYFQAYLNEVSSTIESFINFDRGQKIIEIGCGKGYFLEYLRDKGYDVIGFDPTYEGNASYVHKEYFGSDNISIQGDLLILRHTMEHIQNPFAFLHIIAKANNYKGKIFIEVPTVDWIIENRAFWDIFHEHCNYFNEESFKNLFRVADTGRLFNGQYMYIFGDLANLKPYVDKHVLTPESITFNFEDTFDKWRSWLNTAGDQGVAIWGAGAKGSTFLNILDKNRVFVKCVVDVNPRKQGKFVAVTGHPILSPEHFFSRNDIKQIIVMNPNYLPEISQILEGKNYSVTVL